MPARAPQADVEELEAATAATAPTTQIKTSAGAR